MKHILIMLVLLTLTGAWQRVALDRAAAGDGGSIALNAEATGIPYASLLWPGLPSFFESLPDDFLNPPLEEFDGIALHEMPEKELVHLLWATEPTARSLAALPAHHDVWFPPGYLPMANVTDQYLACLRSRVRGSVCAELSSRIYGGALTDSEWRDLLVGAGVIRARRQSVIGKPWKFGVSVPCWLSGLNIEVSVTSPSPVYEAACVNGTMYSYPGESTISGEVPALPPETRYVQTIVTITRPASWFRNFLCGLDIEGQIAAGGGDFKDVQAPQWIWQGQAPQWIWQGRIDIPVEMVTADDTALRALDSISMREAVEHSLELSSPDQGDGLMTLNVGFNRWWGGPYAAALHRVSVSLDVELWQGSRLIASARQHPPHTAGCSLPEYPSTDLNWKTALTESDLAGCELRIRGTRDGFDVDWNADYWWSGELRIPLRVPIARRAPYSAGLSNCWPTSWDSAPRPTIVMR